MHSSSLNFGTTLTGNISWKFIGKPEDYRKLRSTSSLVLLDQVHGGDIVSVTSDSSAYPPADGFHILKNVAARFPRTTWSIRTADCLPIFLETEDAFFLLHGGWRGLARQILQRAAHLLNEKKIVQMIVGPAAGPSRYEVGQDVIDALGPNAKINAIHPTKPQKYFLDLPETAVAVLAAANALSPSCIIKIHPECTISTPERWHSYRRDNEHRGANALIAGCADSKTLSS